MWPACAAVAVALLVVGCGGEKKPKVDAATEQAEAKKRAEQGPFGTQVKAIDTAKNLGNDVNSKVEDAVTKQVDEAK